MVAFGAYNHANSYFYCPVASVFGENFAEHDLGGREEEREREEEEERRLEKDRRERERRMERRRGRGGISSSSSSSSGEGGGRGRGRGDRGTVYQGELVGRGLSACENEEEESEEESEEERERGKIGRQRAEEEGMEEDEEKEKDLEKEIELKREEKRVIHSKKEKKMDFVKKKGLIFNFKESDIVKTMGGEGQRGGEECHIFAEDLNLARGELRGLKLGFFFFFFP